jgi:eukaryotic-like serine/threonine-protein kinase
VILEEVSVFDLRRAPTETEDLSVTRDPPTAPIRIELDSADSGADAVDLFEDYVLGAEIGRGGMAEVFAATDRRTGEEVALKRVMPALAVHTRMRLRFANEVDLLQRCRGKYVLDVRACGVWEGSPAYVSERCAGSLFDVGRAKPLPLSQVLRYTAEILVALDRVHATGGIHRDIKPSNILLGRDGATRLADFGIARHPENRLTAMGHRVGTPAFSAADLIADPRMAEPGHDLFAVGLLVLTLSTHLRPQTITDPMQRADTLRLFPAATGALLARATALDPGARFKSAAEMALAVQRALAQA